MCYSIHGMGTALNVRILASGGFAKQFLKATVSFVMSVPPPFLLFVCPSVSNNSSSARRIFLKCYSGKFYELSVGDFQVWFKSVKNNRHILCSPERHNVLCGIRAEAEETVAVETINETDRVLCEACAEAEETVALEKINKTDRVLFKACAEAEETVAVETINKTDRVLCEACAEAEETVAVETINDTDRVLCEACAEAEETVALETINETDCVRHVLRQKKQLL